MTAYFDALTRHDLDAIAAAWAPDGVCHIAGQPDAHGPDGVRAWWAEFFGSSPDLRFDGRGPRRRGRPGRRALVGDGHVRGPGLAAGHRADLRAPRPRRARHLPPARRADRLRARLHGRHDARPPDRDAAAGRLDRRAAHDARVQRPGEAQAARGLQRPGAGGRGRLARPRRLPAEDDERLPDRGRGRRRDDVRRRHQGDVDRSRGRRGLARRPQPDRARPLPRRPPRRRAGARRADLLPPRRADRRRGRRRRPLLRLVRPQRARPAGRCRGCCRCGTAGRSRSPARSTRARTSRASASCTSRATRRARSRCSASPTASR